MVLIEIEIMKETASIMKEIASNRYKWNFFFSPIKNEYGKIEMTVRGIDLMKGNPSKARVVYAKIESESLQKIANGITKAFIDAG